MTWVDNPRKFQDIGAIESVLRKVTVHIMNDEGVLLPAQPSTKHPILFFASSGNPILNMMDSIYGYLGDHSSPLRFARAGPDELESQPLFEIEEHVRAHAKQRRCYLGPQVVSLKY
jgi:hypothetical protein